MAVNSNILFPTFLPATPAGLRDKTQAQKDFCREQNEGFLKQEK